MIESRLDYAPVLRAARRAASEMQDKRPLTRSIAGIMFRAVEDNFAEEGRPRWKDLTPGTKLSRYKQGTWPGRILQRSGRLAASIVQSYTSNQAVVGTNAVYGRIQHLGGRTSPHVIKARNKRALSFGGIVVRQVNHPGSNIPARPYLHLTAGDLREIVITANQFHQRAVDRNAASAGGR